MRMPPILWNLKAIREAKCMTERALAKRAGVTYATIIRLEAGGTSRFSTTMKLAEALGEEPKELMGEG
jgi:transcriptional regulator with XRE-family HTH domain